jgi:hypothetical protein
MLSITFNQKQVVRQGFAVTHSQFFVANGERKISQFERAWRSCSRTTISYYGHLKSFPFWTPCRVIRALKKPLAPSNRQPRRNPGANAARTGGFLPSRRKGSACVSRAGGRVAPNQRHGTGGQIVVGH